MWYNTVDRVFASSKKVGFRAGLVAFIWAACLPSLVPHNGPTVYADPIIAPLHVKVIKPLTLLKEPPIKAQESLERVLVIAAVGTYGNNYVDGQCTWLAASRVQVPNSMGNASNWDDYARGIGVTVSSTPKIGAVAQTDAYGLGHVAVVIAVGDGTVTVDEMNYRGPYIEDQRTTPISDWTYLYF